MEDEENKQANKRIAVRIMSPEEQHPGIMEYFQRNLRALVRMISLNNSVYVEVFGETAGDVSLDSILSIRDAWGSCSCR